MFTELRTPIKPGFEDQTGAFPLSHPKQASHGGALGLSAAVTDLPKKVGDV